MPTKKKPSTPKLPTPITAVKHKDKRTNIPTEELRDFIAEDEKKPQVALYPRDPSLDPQLVWKGKDEQDSHPLEVPAVPIYIQEHIKPQAIIELVRSSPSPAGEGAGGGVSQPQLFNDFNGLSFDDRIDFYRHDQSWTNRMILGDSLIVMTSLAEKEGLRGKVQMIYIDPPYGINFGSNWQVSTRRRDITDGRAVDATRQPEQVQAYRDTWQAGIDSYLAYLRDRFVLAREMLSESGSIFVQIGDENVHLIRCVLDEVFSRESFVSQITFRKKLMPLGAKTLENMSDYLLWYAKDRETVKYRQVFSPTLPDPRARWTGLELTDGSRRLLTTEERQSLIAAPEGSRVFGTQPQIAPSFSEKGVYSFVFEGIRYSPPPGACWLTTMEKMERLGKSARLLVESGSPRYIVFHEDFPYAKVTNPWADTPPAQERIYVVQTNDRVIERCLLMTTDPGDLVLDPTCGSGTTAYVAEQWGRRWITIDTSRVAIALARTRLMAARYPYYLLADSSEGRRKEAEASGHVPAASPQGEGGDIKRGFVYERVPHVTLKSIANNEEIDEIHAKYQPELESLRAQINKAAGQKREEWEVPREAPRGAQHIAPVGKYWELRRQRQQEIDISIARRADTEFLYDKPYQDNKRIRVSGPFTVESLSPHRVLSPDDPSTPAREDLLNTQDFTHMILDHLKAAGVQNTIKSQRLKFDRIEPYPGLWIQAVGEYTEKDGKPRRAAISIGPEHGTVGPDLVKEAAKEAVKGVPFDVLIVCGFAFDPHVSEEAKRYGDLTVLPTKMNPDLAMGDELLKKTGTGNLFMVFGEPDLKIEKKDGKLIVHLKGLDVYDPTTGEIRSNSTDDIACWFIDTDYNNETFIVRHAYFTGAGDPYDRLKRALKAEVDESAWSALYSTTSYPFEKPSKGKIAVKVINHYGDEVLKVYEV
jgi:adenine-specific DNA-methyltransferase